MNLAAFYQCYKQRKALNFALTNFRKHYPYQKCHLICDGGLDFSKEAEVYSCSYTYDQKVETNQNLTFNTLNACVRYLERFFSAIREMEEDYVLILEDDVVVLGEVDLSQLKSQVNGCNKQEFLSSNIASDLYLSGVALPSDRGYYYGACGGSILDIEFYKKALKDESSIRQTVEKFCSLSPTTQWASDTILSYICYKNGGTIEQYDGFCETWYPDAQTQLSSGRVKVLHQYKNLYER